MAGKSRYFDFWSELGNFAARFGIPGKIEKNDFLAGKTGDIGEIAVFYLRGQFSSSRPPNPKKVSLLFAS